MGWRYSLRELDTLFRLVEKLPLMSINPGLAEKAEWAHIAYKGGSYPGVLNMTSVLLTPAGKRYLVAMTWNSPTAVDEEAFFQAYGGALGSGGENRLFPMSELYSRRCRSCGASFVYDPQSETLKCPYCGSQETLTPSYEGIQEIDLEEALQAAQTPTSLTGYHVVHCQSCGAEIACQEVPACGFCGSENVSEKALQALPVKPQGVLPFRVSQEEARAAFDRWVRSLWLAPSDLKDKRQIEKIRGFYLPIWTFDAQVWAHWQAELRLLPHTHRTVL